MPMRSLLVSSMTARTARSVQAIVSKQQRPALSVTSQISRQPFRQSQFRTYADKPIVSAETQVKAKKGGFRTLRFLYRLAQLTLVGGLGYVGYGIYESRTPEQQLEPDPSKKTLVVLGTSYRK